MPRSLIQGNFPIRQDPSWIDVEVQARPDQNELEVKVIFDIIGLEVPTQSFTFLLEPTR